jgi:hypothetical protein
MKIYRSVITLVKLKRLIYILVSLIFMQCTFTSTRIKSPEFAVNPDTLQSRLGHLINCGEFNLSGIDKKTNGVSTTELEIEIVNANHLPSQEEERKSLAKILSAEIKKYLADSSAYCNYHVLFVTRKTTAGVTISNSLSYEFSKEDLN